MEEGPGERVCAQVMTEHNYSTLQYRPIHVQRADKSLNLDGLIKATELVVKNIDISDDEYQVADDVNFVKRFKPTKVQTKRERGRPSSDISIGSSERRLIRQSLYVTDNLKYKKKWLRDMLLSSSDTSDDEDDNQPLVSETRFKQMLCHHKQLKKYRDSFSSLSSSVRAEFKDYTWGVLGQCPFPEPLTDMDTQLPQPKKKCSGKTMSAVKGGKHKSHGDSSLNDAELPEGNDDDDCIGTEQSTPSQTPASASAKSSKIKKPPTAEILLARRKKLWHSIVKKDISKAAKARLASRKEMLGNARKCAVAIQKQKRKEAIGSQKAMTSVQSRMKKICREVVTYWRRFEKVEKMQMKKVQKEAQEQRKQDLNMLEAKRQARKLNFLITQTELYAHFMANKISGSDTDKSSILSRLEDNDGLQLHNNSLDDYDAEEMKHQVIYNAEEAYERQTAKTQKFDDKVSCKAAKAGSQTLSISPAPSAATTSGTGKEADYPQPSIFVGQLKTYQIKGMNWLADLYSQGINGILADEMGLGKTVQSLAFLAHLAEVHGIWGPFLVVAPASTLHNWQQESARFLPKMRLVPYWGNTQERKILRKFWDQHNLHTEQASFHIVITSYQLIIQDCKYFSKINWHYMVLDEAQALKSSSSTRWKTLLSFNCRNRLLLTGTPIQNSMAELWALLHFIMPTLFDSHDEFNEWFSKDIESHAENKSTIDQSHLSRLHMILKPFMLRRIKKDVENDLNDKIEVLVYCPLTIRQRYLYDAIKRKIRIEDLLAGVTQAAAASNTTSSLMNLVMQFRKVCNHPELFERRDVKSPTVVSVDPYEVPKLLYREGLLDRSLSSRRHILYHHLYLYNTGYIHERSLNNDYGCADNLFSWTRLVNLSSGELSTMMMAGLFPLISQALQVLKERRQLRHDKLWCNSKSSSKYVGRRLLLVDDELPADHTHTADSAVMSDLIFTDYTSHTSSHLTHSLYYMKETLAHRKIRMKNLTEDTKLTLSPIKRRQHKSLKAKSPPPFSRTKEKITLSDSTDDANVGSNNVGSSTRELGRYHSELQHLHRSLDLQLTDMPSFLTHMVPKAVSAPLQSYCSDRSAQYDYERFLRCGSLSAKDFLRYGPQPHDPQCWYSRSSAGGLQAVHPPFGFSNIYIPDKRSMIVDAGKMHVLDELLTKLKKDGHRVLIYSTMTKLIDLLEEFMWYRKHQYIRLDGSSKISERRDMVSDFQSKTDIFVFLLSTRAGGLGINLTAADTVIFYDSDWNPTVDAQAMDRAHRLGQTKQVTVYRLICKGTIEERILERAREKSEIQRMVISGNNDFKPDVLKAKEVVSLLIDDDSLKQKIEQAQHSKTERADKRKQAAAAKKLDKAEGPKLKRVRKSQTAANGSNKSETSSKCTTPVPLSNGIAAVSAPEDDVDVDSVDASSGTGTAADGRISGTSSPAVNSAVSQSSARSGTPSKSSRAKGRPPKLTSRSPKSKGSAALKKALNAAEIAGTNAAYAAAGITPNSKGVNSKGGGR